MVFATLYAWPVVERRLSGDRATHNILERPSDNPWRTAFGAAFATWVAVPFFAGSSDRIFLAFGIDYEGQVTTMRVLWAVLPVLVFVATLRICRAVRGSAAAARAEASADPA